MLTVVIIIFSKNYEKGNKAGNLSVCLLSYHLSIYLTIYLSVYLTYLFIHLFQERVSHRLEPSLALNLWQSSRLQPSECWDYSNVSRMCIGFLLHHGFFCLFLWGWVFMLCLIANEIVLLGRPSFPELTILSLPLRCWYYRWDPSYLAYTIKLSPSSSCLYPSSPSHEILTIILSKWTLVYMTWPWSRKVNDTSGILTVPLTLLRGGNSRLWLSGKNILNIGKLS